MSEDVRISVRICILGDVFPLCSIIVCAYSSKEQKDGLWSLDLVCVKNLLNLPGRISPQTELNTPPSITNMAKKMHRLKHYVRSESTIAISWAIYMTVSSILLHCLTTVQFEERIFVSLMFHSSDLEFEALLTISTDIYLPSKFYCLCFQHALFEHYLGRSFLIACHFENWF